MDSAILEAFARTPEGEAIKNAVSDQLLRQRKEWAAQRRNAINEYEIVREGLVANEKKAAVELERIRKRAADMIEEATKIYDEKRLARAKEEAKRDRVLDSVIPRLRQAASPKIREFGERLERRRRGLANQLERKFEINKVTGQEECVGDSEGSVKEASLKILALQRDLPELELLALTDDELEQEFERLESTIPVIQIRPLRRRVSGI
jgi:hypothetical protein